MTNTHANTHSNTHSNTQSNTQSEYNARINQVLNKTPQQNDNLDDTESSDDSIISRISNVYGGKREESKRKKENKRNKNLIKKYSEGKQNELTKDEKEKVKYIISAKEWIESDNEINKIQEKIKRLNEKKKEFQKIKEQTEPVINGYLEKEGYHVIEISDGSQIVSTVSRKTEQLNEKTIHKYSTNFFDGILHKNYDFIENEVMTKIQEHISTKKKKDEDYTWDKLPMDDPKKFCNYLMRNPDAISIVGILYASKCREVKETKILKRKNIPKDNGTKHHLNI